MRRETTRRKAGRRRRKLAKVVRDKPSSERQRRINKSATGATTSQNGNQPIHVLLPRNCGKHNSAILPSANQICAIPMAILGSCAMIGLPEE